MATVVGTLIFEMAANVARLQSDMAKANSVVTGTMQDFKNAAGMAAKALGAVGVALSIREFADMVKGTAEAIEHMRDLALRTGNTVEAIGALRPAVKAAGGDLDQMARGLGFLAKNMLTVADSGKGPAAAAFKELGIAVADASGKLRPSAEVMQDVAVKLAEMEDRTRAAALAKVMLGKSGQDLLPILEEMARLGRQQSAVTTAQAESAHQFMMNLRSLEAQSAAVKREFVTGMLPALTSISQAFLDARGNSDAAHEAGAAFGTLLQWLAQAAAGAWAVIRGLGQSIGLLAATFDQLKSGNVMGAINVIREGMKDISESAAKAGEQIRKMGEEAAKSPPPARRSGGAAPATGTGVGDANYAGEFADGGTIGAGMWGIVGEAGPEIVSAGAGGVNVTPMGGGRGLAGLAASAGSLKAVLQDTKILGTDLGTVLDRAGARGVRSMSDLQGVLRNVAIELIKAGRTPLIKYLTSGAGAGGGGDYVGDLPIDDAAGSGGGFGDLFAGLFAGGGTVPAGMWGIAGEAGPELISGGTSGASVTPMGGGGMSVSFGDININAPGADAAKLSQVIAAVNNLRASVPTMAVIAMQKMFNQRGYATPVG